MEKAVFVTPFSLRKNQPVFYVKRHRGVNFYYAPSSGGLIVGKINILKNKVLRVLVGWFKKESCDKKQTSVDYALS